MEYTCDTCFTKFNLFPGNGYIGPYDFMNKHCGCNLTLITLCPNCLGTNNKVPKRNFYLEDELMEIVLKNENNIIDIIQSSMYSTELQVNTNFLIKVADAIRFKDPKLLGEIMYPVLRDILLDLIKRKQEQGELIHINKSKENNNEK